MIPASPATRILRHDHDGRHAAALFRRYRELFIGDAIVRGMLRLIERPDDPATREAFERDRRRWEGRGGYIETITLEEVSSWIDSSAYIVAEAGDPRASDQGRFEAVADCVYRLPEDDWVIPRLTPAADQLHDPDHVAAILDDGPGASAIIDYLGVRRECADKRLAGDARYAGMRELVRRNTGRPPGQRIRHVLGMTFAVQGLEILDPDGTGDDGETVWLADLGQPEIVNQASLRAISVSRRCPAKTVGKWLGAPPVPIVVDGRRYALHTHWHCHVRAAEGALGGDHRLPPPEPRAPTGELRRGAP